MAVSLPALDQRYSVGRSLQTADFTAHLTAGTGLATDSGQYAVAGNLPGDAESTGISFAQ